MRLKKLPSECIAPFRLKEITLHGIGSYYKPARLEIKPLTILCGTNGSGKSTWMKVLNVLKNALMDEDGVKQNNFFDRLGDAIEKPNLVNKRWKEGNGGQNGLEQKDAGWNTYCGPFGSFSVSLTCLRTMEIRNVFPAVFSANTSPFFQRDQIHRGDNIRLRFTQFKYAAKQQKILRYMCGRISINNQFVEIRVQAKEDKNMCDPNSKYSIFTGSEDGNDLRAVDTDSQEIDRVFADPEALIRLSEEFAEHFFAGYFPISAIRPIQTGIPPISPSIIDARYVGMDGKYCHEMRRHLSTVPVLDPRGNYSYCATQNNLEDIRDALSTPFEGVDEIYKQYCLGNQGGVQ
jgi:energy-coupling factor transporter ATP-binding protein EcfA2